MSTRLDNIDEKNLFTYFQYVRLHVAKELNEKCQCCLKIKASDTAQAAILIEKNLHTKNYEILSDNNIRIFEYVDNPGIVNSLLVNHGISVDECTVTKESLEDYFNEKMRGGIVNA